ncbi:MAG: D-glycero-beta-D-manno-heptose 1-phosphate adenylyltransferase [Calditrichia bacterium]
MSNKINKLYRLNEFLPFREKLSKTHKKLVFTNGCFDIIHRGHVEYLTKAKHLGDVLVVGLNTDDSVRRIKGDKRPLVDQDSRAVVLSALEVVDYIIFFDDDTPLELIKAIKPDVLVKGADYRVEDIVGADVVLASGGEVKPIELTEGFSTSSLIEKIVSVYC